MLDHSIGEQVNVAFAPDCVGDLARELANKLEDGKVLLLENLYGDIVSDLAAGLVGGLGLVPGANLGEGVAIFEAVHGTAPDIAGTDRANPTALLMSAILMLRHLDLPAVAERVEHALLATLRAGVKTPDIGGTAGTKAFAAAVAARVRA